MRLFDNGCETVLADCLHFHKKKNYLYLLDIRVTARCDTSFLKESLYLTLIDL